jgi:hypothetical protein
MNRILVVLLSALVLWAVVAAAGPVKTARTLVTDAEIAAWQADPDLLPSILNANTADFCAAVGQRPAATWVEKDDEWLWRLLLPTTIKRTLCVGDDSFSAEKLGCPRHGGQIYSVNAFYPWIVDCEKLPGKLSCPTGGEAYPSNDFAAGDLTSGDYPDDGDGWVKDGKRYRFIGLYAHYAYNTGVVPAVRSLSRAFTLTADPRYAHKTGVLLLKVATEYPNSTDRKDRTFQPGYGEFSGMITMHVWEAAVLETFAYAYDETFAAMRQDAELLRFAHGKVPKIATADDLQVYLEERLFRPGVQALFDARLKPNAGWGQASMATLALMLNDYSDKHPNTADAMEWLYHHPDGNLRFVGNQFYKDGSSYESSGYNDSRESFLRVGELVKRIKTLAPKPYDEQRYPDVLGNEKVQQFRNYRAVIWSAVGRNFIAIGDGGSVSAVPLVARQRREPVRQSEFLDGYGLAVLRDLADECNGTLFYGGVRSHAHYDPLFIGLHAYGRDLLPNIGYPQSFGLAAPWEYSLITHMTVAVDRDEKPSSTVIGSLNLFDTGAVVQVMEASKRPYRKNEPRGEDGPDVRDYRRMVVQVNGGAGAEEDNYLLDIFRVTGGRDHLQSWHGPYTPDPVVIEGPVTLVAQRTGTLAGPKVEYGKHYKDAAGKDRWDPYCYLKNVAFGALSEVTAITWTPKTQEPVHLRLNFVPIKRLELIRADGGAPIAPEQNVLQWAFQHRTGTTDLRSVFVTLVEPYAQARFILGISRLPVQGTDPSGYAPVALQVSFAKGRDLLLATGDPRGELRGEGFRLVGRFGFIREREGRVVAMHLTEGSLLQFGSRELKAPTAAATAKIVAVKRGAREITVAGTLGATADLAGKRLLVDNHGERICSYTIVSAAALPDGRTRLVLDSNGVLGEGIASGYEEGVIRNGPTINMPFAGLVRLPDGRLDYSDCFYYGAHLENGKRGVALRVRGVMGFPYQAWSKLSDAGSNHVYLVDKIPGAKLETLLADQPQFTLYEYGVGDAVRLDRAAHLELPPDKAP